MIISWCTHNKLLVQNLFASALCIKACEREGVQLKIRLQRELCNNLLEWVRNDLKTILSLAMPNLYCLDVTKKILSWFWGYILGQEIPNLHDPYIQYYCDV